MAGTPAWQRAVLAVQARATPTLRKAVDQPDVAAAIALLQNARHELSRVAEAPARRVLHLLNLPAGSDVNRLLVQIAHLEREVRALRKRLDDGPGGAPYSGVGSAGPPRVESTSPDAAVRS